MSRQRAKWRCVPSSRYHATNGSKTRSPGRIRWTAGRRYRCSRPGARCSAGRIDDLPASDIRDFVPANPSVRSSQVRGCYLQLEREERKEGGEVRGGRGLARAPRVLEVELKSVLSGYLDHRLTQDVGINLGDEEGIMDGEWAPPTPPDHPGHDLYGHVRIL